MQYLTKENITLVIAIVGAVGTFTMWIYTLIVNRKNISFSIIAAYYSRNSLYIYFIIENKARLNLSINSIALLVNGEKFFCQRIPMKIYERNEEKEYFSCRFPISLSSLCGDSGYLYFKLQNAELDFSEKLNVIISTNRGKDVLIQVEPNYKDNFKYLI